MLAMTHSTLRRQRLLPLLFALALAGRACGGVAVGDTLTPAPPYVWQHPLPAVATASALALGSGTLFVPTLQRANSLVREEVQLMRRSMMGHRLLQFDNGLQYVPVIAVVGLRLLGVQSQHEPTQLLLRAASGIAVTTLIVQPLKYAINERRPSGVSDNSFPSGHTAFAFCGAELLRLEYGANAAWVPATGFALAGLTAFMRIFNDRHWTGDVLAGAAIGVVAADLTDLLNRWLVDPHIEHAAPQHDDNEYLLQ